MYTSTATTTTTKSDLTVVYERMNHVSLTTIATTKSDCMNHVYTQ